RAVHHRDPRDQAGVVQQVARGEVVGAVDDHVVAGDDVEHVLGGQPLGVLVDGHAGGDRLDRGLGGVDLGLADAVDGVQDLALEVRDVDGVGVDDAQRADAGGGQVDGRRRGE